MKEDIAFTNAKKIMEALEYIKPWEDIADLLVEDCPHICQADMMKDITTVKQLHDWKVNFNENVAPGCKPIVHNLVWDAPKKTALKFSTYVATHTGDGGPVPATNKTTNTHYVFICEMNDENKCICLTKVWNDDYCKKEIGWD